MSHKDVAPQLRQFPSFLPCRCWTRPQRTTWSTWAPAPRPCSATRPAWPRAPRPRWRLASLASVRTHAPLQTSKPASTILIWLNMFTLFYTSCFQSDISHQHLIKIWETHSPASRAKLNNWICLSILNICVLLIPLFITGLMQVFEITTKADFASSLNLALMLRLCPCLEVFCEVSLNIWTSCCTCCTYS